MAATEAGTRQLTTWEGKHIPTGALGSSQLMLNVAAAKSTQTLKVTQTIFLILRLHALPDVFAIRVFAEQAEARVRQHNSAVVNCQFSMATFSTGERRRRPKGDRSVSPWQLF